MNWLAHLLLSGGDPDIMVGNLLPDLMRPGDIRHVHPRYCTGIRLHRAIDDFTDAHPLVRQSRRRVTSQPWLISGVVVDVLYDHLLACAWERYNGESLRGFCDDAYRHLLAAAAQVPAPAACHLRRLCHTDLLYSYADEAGVHQALTRLSMRLRGRYALGDAMADLHRNRASLQADFDTFFPQLLEHAKLPQ